MTPMIDVVFLLIIFFLVSSHLAKQETRLPVELPHASTALDDDLDVAPLTVNVDAQSRWHLAARPIEIESLREAFKDYHTNSSRPAFRIRTDRGVPYQAIEPLLREAARVGITDVRVAVYAESSP